jgi:hypothetical protein
VLLVLVIAVAGFGALALVCGGLGLELLRLLADVHAARLAIVSI